MASVLERLLHVLICYVLLLSCCHIRHTLLIIYVMYLFMSCIEVSHGVWML